MDRNERFPALPEETVLTMQAIARDGIRGLITANYTRIRDLDGITPEELAEAEVATLYAEPGVPGFPGDKPSREEIREEVMGIVNYVLDHPEVIGEANAEAEEDAAELYPEVMAEVDRAERNREDRMEHIREILVDHNAVSALIAAGLDQASAIEHVLETRTEDVDSAVSFWRSSYFAAKRYGFAVHPDILDFCRSFGVPQAHDVLK